MPLRFMNSLVRRFLLPGLAAAWCGAILSAAHGQDVLDGIAAKVNGDVVTLSQVRMVVGAKEKAAREQFKGEALNEKIKEIRLQAVNDLIDRQLILQEFKKMKEKGANIPDHVVDERVDSIVRDEFGGNRAAFIRTLAAEGWTLDRFREDQMNSIIVQAMRSQQVKANTVIPEPKIAEFYHQNIEQYTTEEQLKLRMIVIKKEGESDARRKTIEEIRQKIVGGAAFEDLARLYSEDNSTQESGGDWGWISRRTLNESLSKVAFSLKPGEVSKIVEQAGNYYLLFCEARKSQVTRSFAQVHDEIQKALLQEERQKAQEKWLAKLRKAAFIQIM